jgi:predicted nucleic acid-binding protein
MPEIVIVDTSSLIALDKIDLLPLLCKIYSEVLIPETVIKEFGDVLLPCASIKKLESNLIKLLITDLNLGRGEAEVIALASQIGTRMMVDDLRARKIAANMGLTITGTIGFLIKAAKLGLIKSAYEKVQELRNKGFYVSDKLFDRIKKLE